MKSVHEKYYQIMFIGQLQNKEEQKIGFSFTILLEWDGLRKLNRKKDL